MRVVRIRNARGEVEEGDVGVELLGEEVDVDRQAALVGPHAEVVDLVALVIHERILPDGGEEAGVRDGARADVRLAEAGGVLRHTEVSPRSLAKGIALVCARFNAIGNI